MNKIVKFLLCGLLCVCIVGCDNINEKSLSENTVTSSQISSSSSDDSLSNQDKPDTSMPDLENAEYSNKIVNLDDLLNSYLTPLIYCSGSVLTNWENVEQITANSFFWLYGYSVIWISDIPESEYVYEENVPYYYVDASLLEEYVQKYFDVSTEYLRTAEEYFPDKQAYRYNMMGVGFVDETQIIYAEYDFAERNLILYLYNDYIMNESKISALTIHLNEDGSYKYVKNIL